MRKGNKTTSTISDSKMWPQPTSICLWSCRNINIFDHRVLFWTCWRCYIINISITLALSKQRTLNSEKTFENVFSLSPAGKRGTICFWVREKKTWLYSWALSNTRLNCAGTHRHGFFPINTYYGTAQSMVGQSADVEPWVWRARCNVRLIFHCAEAQCS